MNKQDIIISTLKLELNNYKKAFLSFYTVFNSFIENSQNITIKEYNSSGYIIKNSFHISFGNEQQKSVFTIRISIEYKNNKFIKNLYFMDNIDYEKDISFNFNSFKELKELIKHSETLSFILRKKNK